MGFKATNYEVKDSGIVYPEVYAICKSVHNTRGECRAVFAISTSRENAITKTALETVEINFSCPINAEVDLFALAYKAAKGTKTKNRYDAVNNVMVQYEEKMPFYDWTDDIQGD